jgi:hypothetical protein
MAPGGTHARAGSSSSSKAQASMVAARAAVVPCAHNLVLLARALVLCYSRVVVADAPACVVGWASLRCSLAQKTRLSLWLFCAWRLLCSALLSVFSSLGFSGRAFPRLRLRLLGAWYLVFGLLPAAACGCLLLLLLLLLLLPAVCLLKSVCGDKR